GPLATPFLREITSDAQAELPPDILSMLATYSWPGNVRELKNVVNRIAFLDAKNRRDLFDVTSSLHARVQAPSEEDLSTLPYHDARQLVLECAPAPWSSRECRARAATACSNAWARPSPTATRTDHGRITDHAFAVHRAPRPS